MPVVVSPTATNPTHHIKLSAGGTDIGLILRSGNRIDPRAINRRPRANGQYSPFTQSDWGSGRGIKDAGSDRSRFGDSKRAITRHGGTVMIGGQETYSTGYRQAESFMPGKVTWQSLLSANRYIAHRFTASATGNRAKVYIWIRRRGTPTSTLTLELCTESFDAPASVLKTVTVTTATITDTISQLYEFTFSSVQAVTSGTRYWIKIYPSTADDSSNYWEVGTDAADTDNLTKVSSNDIQWNACSFDLYFRIVDDTGQLGGLFFYYKSQLYFLARPTSSAAPKLYMNGYRGIATGTHSTTTLQDTTQSWTTNALAGSVMLIIDGQLSEYQASYRTIVSNTATTITFSPSFARAPVSNDSVYVVLGSNVWTEITGHGLTVLPTDVTAESDICYFAQGDGTKMRRMREYNNNAVWTREFAEEDNYAKFLLSYRHPSRGAVIGKVNDKSNTGIPAFAYAKPESWGRRLAFPFLIHNCESTTSWVAGANGAIVVDNAVFQTGVKSLKLTITGAPGSPILYFPISINASTGNALRFWVRSDANRAAGDLKVFLSTSATAATQLEILSVPALVNGEWTQVTLPYNNTISGGAVVASIGFQTLSTSGSYWLDGIEMIVSGSETPLGNIGEKITGMDLYGDPEVPWVFRQRSAGSVENGTFNPIPLRELATAENVYNGTGHTVHNVNLYFSFLHGLERFYRNNLDDVGPNRDEGLPDDRRGFITSMRGYIGRFLYNYDVLEGYSAILESTSGTDHHEAYRCDAPGKRIRKLFIQTVPGDTADRLWFTEGDDIAWLPLPGNTLKEDTDSTFRFTHEAVLETGWITGTQPDAVKIFSNIKLFTENTSSNRKIEWDYQIDETGTWTPVSTAFTSPSVQEVTLNISAKRLKLRFRLQTNDNTLTPKIKQLFVGATTRPETRWTYTISTSFDDAAIDLEGTESTGTRAATIIAQLDSWMEANTILTMRSVIDSLDNKQVILEPVVLTPYVFIADESLEKLLGTVTLLEP